MANGDQQSTDLNTHLHIPRTSETSTASCNGFLSSGVTSIVAGLHSDQPTRDGLETQVQQLITDINSKRKEDTKLLSDFRRDLTTHVQCTLEAAESGVFNMYDHQSQIIDAKVNELFITFDRITKIEKELEEFSSALRTLCKEIQDDI